MSTEPIDFDSMLEMCQNQHRQIVLEVLAEDQRSLTLNELAEAIFEYKHQTPPTEVSENVLTEIRLSLYHVDLPNLAAEGFINYDREHELVEPAEQLDRVRPILSTIFAADPSVKAPVKL